MEIHRDGTRLVLAGDFDVRSTREARSALYDLLDGVRGEGRQEVVVDLTDVESVDLTALRVLAVATRAAERRGHHLVLRGCRPCIRRLLLISRLDRLLDLERPVDPGVVSA